MEKIAQFTNQQVINMTEEDKDKIMEFLDEIRIEVGICCMSSMDPDHVETQIDEIEKILSK